MSDEANVGDSKAWDLTPGAAKCLAWLPAGFEGRDKAQMCLMQSVGVDPLVGGPRCSQHHSRNMGQAPPTCLGGCSTVHGIHGSAVRHEAGCPTLAMEMARRLTAALPPEAPLPPLAAGAAAVAARPGEGVKADAGKPRLELESQAARMGLGAVLTYGAKKYADDNWRKGMGWRRLLGAAQRHLAAFAAGEDNDLESGLPHIDHAACCLHFLSEYQKTGRGTDDRFVEGPFVTRGEATS